MTAASSTTAAPAVHAALLELSRRLEVLWAQTRAAAEAVDRDGTAANGWQTADERLARAMVALEGYAGRRDPHLGRRDWQSRDVRARGRAGGRVPAQRVATRPLAAPSATDSFA